MTHAQIKCRHDSFTICNELILCMDLTYNYEINSDVIKQIDLSVNLYTHVYNSHQIPYGVGIEK